MGSSLLLVIGIIILIVLQLLFALSRYKNCPPDMILVVYGRVSENPQEKYKAYTSGRVFVWPVLQEFTYLDANTKVEKLENSFLTSDNKYVRIELELSYKLSRQEEWCEIAAKNFYTKEEDQIKEVIKERLIDYIKKETSVITKAQIEFEPEKLKRELKDGIQETLNKQGVEVVSIMNMKIWY